jgi:hypothetical protein
MVFGLESPFLSWGDGAKPGQVRGFARSESAKDSCDGAIDLVGGAACVGFRRFGEFLYEICFLHLPKDYHSQSGTST